MTDVDDIYRVLQEVGEIPKLKEEIRALNVQNKNLQAMVDGLRAQVRRLQASHVDPVDLRVYVDAINNANGHLRSMLRAMDEERNEQS